MSKCDYIMQPKGAEKLTSENQIIPKGARITIIEKHLVPWWWRVEVHMSFSRSLYRSSLPSWARCPSARCRTRKTGCDDPIAARLVAGAVRRMAAAATHCPCAYRYGVVSAAGGVRLFARHNLSTWKERQKIAKSIMKPSPPHYCVSTSSENSTK